MAWYGAFQLEFIDPDCRCIHLAITALFIMPKWIIPCSARGCNFCLCCYFVPSTFFLSAPPSVLQIFRSTCVVIVVAPDGKYLHERTLWQQRPTAASCVRHHCDGRGQGACTYAARNYIHCSALGAYDVEFLGSGVLLYFRRLCY